MRSLTAAYSLCVFAPLLAAPAAAQRVTMPLDGEWSIEESVGPEELPASFPHRVQVPGLVHNAVPGFAGVDQYINREYVLKKIRLGLMPASAAFRENGRTDQKRSYFWYKTSFRPRARKQVAILHVNKAQFGTAVWVNGKKIGEHLGCFTAGVFDITPAVDWGAENALLIRIGAHPGALPEWVPAGTDDEKLPWTPGIYDSVSLQLSDNPVIETIQVAPRIQNSEIIIQTRVKNYGGGPVTAKLEHVVKPWKGSTVAARAPGQKIQLQAGESKTITQTIRIPGAQLWTPENPALYVVETTTGGDSRTTRFGMREFRFDTATRRAYLNGHIYYLRGSSLTLHRFFGDPLSRQHPWEEAWVRKLLVDIPKRMHWNSFRTCIGPTPEMWLDIADEAGLLIDWEYAVWTGGQTWRHELWKTDELIREYTEYLQDSWNHPSVVIWDASNETTDDALRDGVIPAVRKLDLSNRPWENGYSMPQGPDDPYEDHPYLFSSYAYTQLNPGANPRPPFQMTDLETMDGHKQAASAPSGHASFINEYGWLWLRRDGTPTYLTRNAYEALAGPRATPEQRFQLYGYLLGGLSEFWRAYRHYAGVLYLAYLDADVPDAFTGDNFRDPEKLELEPNFQDYVGEAFKPVGVYINFWQPELNSASSRRYRVMMVNDEWEPAKGQLAVSFTPAGGGAEVSRKEVAFDIPASGQMTYDLTLAAPSAAGEYLLKATASCPGRSWSPVVSRRKVTVRAVAASR